MRHFLLLAFIFIANTGFAQSNSVDSTSLAKPNESLYIVNGIIFGNNDAFQRLVNISDVENIEVLKNSNSTTLFCWRGDRDIVLVTLKNDVQVLSYAQLLDKFKIKRKYRKYAAYLDKNPISETKDFYISSSKAVDVKLDYVVGNGDIPYINIVINK